MISKKGLELPMMVMISIIIAIAVLILLVAFSNSSLLGLRESTEQNIFSQVGIR